MADGARLRWLLRYLLISLSAISISSHAMGQLVPPSDLTIYDGNLMAHLRWTPARGAGLAGYAVYRKVGREGTYIRLNKRPTKEMLQLDNKTWVSFFEDPNVRLNTTYFYRVAAVTNSPGETGFSNEASISFGHHRMAEIALDADRVLHPIDQSLYGGKLHFFWNEDFARDIEALKALGPQLWVWLNNVNNKTGYRWDVHSLSPGSSVAS